MSTALKLTHLSRSAGDALTRMEATGSSRARQAVIFLRMALAADTTLLVLTTARFLAMQVGPRIVGYQGLTMLSSW